MGCSGTVDSTPDLLSIPLEIESPSDEVDEVRDNSAELKTDSSGSKVSGQVVVWFSLLSESIEAVLNPLGECIDSVESFGDKILLFKFIESMELFGDIIPSDALE